MSAAKEIFGDHTPSSAPTVHAQIAPCAVPESTGFTGLVVTTAEAQVVDMLGRLRSIVAAGHGPELYAKAEWEALLWHLREATGYTPAHERACEQAVVARMRAP